MDDKQLEELALDFYGKSVDAYQEFMRGDDTAPDEVIDNLKKTIQQLVREAQEGVHQWYIEKANKVSEVFDTDLQHKVTLESIVYAAKSEIAALHHPEASKGEKQ